MSPKGRNREVVLSKTNHYRAKGAEEIAMSDSKMAEQWQWVEEMVHKFGVDRDLFAERIGLPPRVIPTGPIRPALRRRIISVDVHGRPVDQLRFHKEISALTPKP